MQTKPYMNNKIMTVNTHPSQRNSSHMAMLSIHSPGEKNDAEIDGMLLAIQVEFIDAVVLMMQLLLFLHRNMVFNSSLYSILVASVSNELNDKSMAIWTLL